jgi:hypothetical protein
VSNPSAVRSRSIAARDDTPAVDAIFILDSNEENNSLKNVRATGTTAVSYVTKSRKTHLGRDWKGSTAWRRSRGSNDADDVFRSVLEISDFQLAAGTLRVPATSARG